MNYLRQELENIEYLLTSPIQINIELGLELVANDEVLINHFKTYLEIIYVLVLNNSLIKEG